MTFKQKIDIILKTNKLDIDSIYGLEKKIGSSVGSIRKFYEKNELPGLKVIKKIISVLDINPHWWEEGLNPIYKKNITEVLETHLKTEIGQTDNNPNRIPFYDTVAVGGLTMLADQEPVYAHQSELIDPGTWFKSASGALRVYGHSMFPKYPAGCIVAFKESDKDVIIWGEDYVIELSDRRIVKRVEKSKELGCVCAVSYNKSEEYVYSPIDIPIAKIKRLYMVLGKVELEASI